MDDTGVKYGNRKGCNRQLLLLAGVLVTIGITVSILVAVLRPKKSVLNDERDRLECPGVQDEASCKKLGCLWSTTSNNVPSCYMPKQIFGYLIEGEKKMLPNGFTVDLKRKSNNSMFGESIENVRFEVAYITENVLRFKFVNADKARYEVPVQKQFPLLSNPPQVDDKALRYEVNVENSKDFAFKVKRKSDGTILWDTGIGSPVISDQYLQLASYLPSENIYGIGENPHPTFKHDLGYKSWTLFSRDQFPIDKNKHLYGVHPFYTCLEKGGKSHGVLFLNSNAMDVTLLPHPAISFRTIGGILDFFIIIGEDPEEVVQRYTELIGRPMLPPYWSLGFQLSRYGYKNLDNVQKVVERTRKASIAQDVQIVDIDHMQSNRDFTWDQTNFKGLDEYIKKTKQEYGLKWIIILDPAIEAITKDYDVYTTGASNEVFIKRSPDMNSTLFPESIVNTANATFGKVWPNGPVAFPDFFNPRTSEWWMKLIKEHREKLNFDGLWIDMNEPSNFGTNDDHPSYCPEKESCWSLKCPRSTLDDPPYNPVFKSTGRRLSQQTICMDSIQGDGNTLYKHYDVHSLYGWSQIEPTLKAAQEATKERSLVISRSTYVSSGQHTGHWLGDNRSQWKDLHRSIIGMLEFNLFGIPYIGADVCGFFGDTTDEMCKRWMQLGAFYPFFRNHNGWEQKDQDPAAMSEDTTNAARAAVSRRYKLRPYLYDLFYKAHVYGNTVVRPLFHEYSADPTTWNIDTQFMWGKWLLVSPILNEGQTSVRLYLPKDKWFLFKEKESGPAIHSDGKFIDYSVNDGDIPLHIRGGVILPTEEYELGQPNKKTTNITLYVFPKEGKAKGQLFWDDGVSIDSIKDKSYVMADFDYDNCNTTINTGQTKVQPSLILKQVVIFEASDVKKVFLNGDPYEDFVADGTSNVLTVNVNEVLNSISILWEDSKKACTFKTK